MGWINTFKRQGRDRGAALRDRRIYLSPMTGSQKFKPYFPDY